MYICGLKIFLTCNYFLKIFMKLYLYKDYFYILEFNRTINKNFKPHLLCNYFIFKMQAQHCFRHMFIHD